jgi:hypothetical protein
LANLNHVSNFSRPLSVQVQARHGTDDCNQIDSIVVKATGLGVVQMYSNGVVTIGDPVGAVTTYPLELVNEHRLYHKKLANDVEIYTLSLFSARVLVEWNPTGKVNLKVAYDDKITFYGEPGQPQLCDIYGKDNNTKLADWAYGLETAVSDDAMLFTKFEKGCADGSAPPNTEPCSGSDLEKAKKFCAPLKDDDRYEGCRADKNVTEQEYYDACLASRCNACGDYSASAGCQTYKTYEAACREAGVHDLGTVVDECGKCFGDGSTCAAEKVECTGHGRGFYSTFDGVQKQFAGECEYVVLNDCQIGSFSEMEVQVRHGDCNGDNSTMCLTAVAVQLNSYDVTVDDKGVVLTNEHTGPVSIANDESYTIANGIVVSRETGLVSVKLPSGVIIVYQYSSLSLRIEASDAQLDGLCGLCGPYNDDKSDDFLALDAADSTWKYGTGLAVGYSSHILQGADRSCADNKVAPADPCDDAPASTKKIANEMCYKLKNGAGDYAGCHHLIPVEPYYQACRQAVCTGGIYKGDENTDLACGPFFAYQDVCAVHEAKTMPSKQDKEVCTVDRQVGTCTVIAAAMHSTFIGSIYNVPHEGDFVLARTMIAEDGTAAATTTAAAAAATTTLAATTTANKTTAAATTTGNTTTVTTITTTTTTSATATTTTTTTATTTTLYHPGLQVQITRGLYGSDGVALESATGEILEVGNPRGVIHNRKDLVSFPFESDSFKATSDGYRVTVTFKADDWTVIWVESSRMVQIQVAAAYKGTLQGLCGDFTIGDDWSDMIDHSRRRERAVTAPSSSQLVAFVESWLANPSIFADAVTTTATTVTSTVTTVTTVTAKSGETTSTSTRTTLTTLTTTTVTTTKTTVTTTVTTVTTVTAKPGETTSTSTRTTATTGPSPPSPTPTVGPVVEEKCVAGSARETAADKYCTVLSKTNGPYADCLELVDPAAFVKECRFKLCTTTQTDFLKETFGSLKTSGACSSFKSFEQMCTAKGVNHFDSIINNCNVCFGPSPCKDATKGPTTTCKAFQGKSGDRQFFDVEYVLPFDKPATLHSLSVGQCDLRIAEFDDILVKRVDGGLGPEWFEIGFPKSTELKHVLISTKEDSDEKAIFINSKSVASLPASFADGSNVKLSGSEYTVYSAQTDTTLTFNKGKISVEVSEERKKLIDAGKGTGICWSKVTEVKCSDAPVVDRWNTTMTSTSSSTTLTTKAPITTTQSTVTETTITATTLTSSTATTTTKTGTSTTATVTTTTTLTTATTTTTSVTATTITATTKTSTVTTVTATTVTTLAPGVTTTTTTLGAGVTSSTQTTITTTKTTLTTITTTKTTTTKTVTTITSTKTTTTKTTKTRTTVTKTTTSRTTVTSTTQTTATSSTSTVTTRTDTSTTTTTVTTTAWKFSCPGKCKNSLDRCNEVKDVCGALKDPDGSFKDCHAAVDPEPFYKACLIESCALESGAKPDVFSTYFELCLAVEPTAEVKPGPLNPVDRCGVVFGDGSSCADDYSKCSSSGSGTYSLFSTDAAWMTTECLMTLAKSCSPGEFEVNLQHLDDSYVVTINNPSFSIVLSGSTGSSTVHLATDGFAMKSDSSYDNNAHEDKPLLLEDGTTISSKKGVVQVRLGNVDVTVHLDNDGVAVDVADKALDADKVCGVCALANLTSISADTMADLFSIQVLSDAGTPQTPIASQSGGKCTEINTKATVDDDDQCSSEVQLKAEEYCSVISDPNGGYVKCHEKVPPGHYETLCVAEYCASEGASNAAVRRSASITLYEDACKPIVVTPALKDRCGVIGGDGTSCPPSEGSVKCTTYGKKSLSTFSGVGMQLKDGCSVVLSKDINLNKFTATLNLQDDAPSVTIEGVNLPEITLRSNVFTVPARLNALPADVVIANLLNQPRASLADLFTKKLLKYNGKSLVKDLVVETGKTITLMHGNVVVAGKYIHSLPIEVDGVRIIVVEDGVKAILPNEGTVFYDGTAVTMPKDLKGILGGSCGTFNQTNNFATPNGEDAAVGSSDEKHLFVKSWTDCNEPSSEQAGGQGTQQEGVETTTAEPQGGVTTTQTSQTTTTTPVITTTATTITTTVTTVTALANETTSTSTRTTKTTVEDQGQGQGQGQGETTTQGQGQDTTTQDGGGEQSTTAVATTTVGRTTTTTTTTGIPCDSDEAIAAAKTFCKPLRDDSYDICGDAVDRAPFLESCMATHCVSPSDACKSLSAYEAKCDHLGIVDFTSVIDRCGECHGEGRSCQSDISTCRSFGSQYQVFSGEHFSFDGQCDYTLAEPCDRKHFSVHVHKDIPSGQLDTVAIKIEFVGVLSLNENRSVTLDDKALDIELMPITLNDGSTVDHHQGEVIVSLRRSGVVIKWYSNARIIDVALPPSLLTDMCGICGVGTGLDHNFGPSPYSSSMCSYAEDSAECVYEQSGYSYAVPAARKILDTTCETTVPIVDNPCDKDQRKLSKAKRHCDSISAPNGVYKHCHAEVNPELFFDACVREMCIDTQEKTCPVFHAYERSCREQGVRRMGSVIDKCGTCFGDGSECSDAFGIGMMWADPHFMTLDERFYDFDGGCDYVLLKDCVFGNNNPPAFEIHVQNRNVSGWMQAHALGIRIPGVAYNNGIAMYLEGRVNVDAKFLDDGDFPYMLSDGTTIQRSLDKTVTVILGTQRIEVTWTAEGAITTQIPNQYQNAVCGLFGNFDGNKTGNLGSLDLTRMSGVGRQSAIWEAASSWTVEAWMNDVGVSVQTAQQNQESCSAPQTTPVTTTAAGGVTTTIAAGGQQGEETTTAPQGGEQAQTTTVGGPSPPTTTAVATTTTAPGPADNCADEDKYRSCLALKNPDGPYAVCHAKVSPTTFFDTCASDACEGMEVCATFKQYETLCKAKGVTPTGIVDRCGRCGGDGTTCPEKFATCVAFGKSKFTTFDGSAINFPGLCTHIMARDCVDGAFEVQIFRASNGNAIALLTKSNGVIEVTLDGTVIVDDKTINSTIFTKKIKNGGSIEKSQSRVMIKLPSMGLSVLRQKGGLISVEVDERYKSKTCGLCGTYTNNKDDDLLLADGTSFTFATALREYKLGRSYHVQAPEVAVSEGNPICRDDTDPPPTPCAKRPQSVPHAKQVCAVLKDGFGPLAGCFDEVPADEYYESCLQDVCGWTTEVDTCPDSMQAYRKQCIEKGVTDIGTTADECDVCYGDGSSCASEHNQCVVLGGNKVITFDQASFDWVGTCDFVLADAFRSGAQDTEVQVVRACPGGNGQSTDCDEPVINGLAVKVGRSTLKIFPNKVAYLGDSEIGDVTTTGGGSNSAISLAYKSNVVKITFGNSVKGSLVWDIGASTLVFKWPKTHMPQSGICSVTRSTISQLDWRVSQVQRVKDSLRMFAYVRDYCDVPAEDATSTTTTKATTATPQGEGGQGEGQGSQDTTTASQGGEQTQDTTTAPQGGEQAQDTTTSAQGGGEQTTTTTVTTVTAKPGETTSTSTRTTATTVTTITEDDDDEDTKCEPTAEQLQSCAFIKDRTGPFGECHDAVDPRPYYDMCYDLACRKDGGSKRVTTAGKTTVIDDTSNPCYIRKVYSAVCASAGVTVADGVDRCGECGGDGSTCASDFLTCQVYDTATVSAHSYGTFFFEEECTHVLAQSSDFAVHMQRGEHGSKLATAISLAVRVGHVSVVEISMEGNVYKDGTIQSGGFVLSDGTKVTISGKIIAVAFAGDDTTVQWNLATKIITLEFRKTVEEELTRGLCINELDSAPVVYKDEKLFKEPKKEVCRVETGKDKCQASLTVKANVEKRCSAMADPDGLFGECHAEVDKAEYIAACIAKICTSDAAVEETWADKPCSPAAHAYKAACGNAGVAVSQLETKCNHCQIKPDTAPECKAEPENTKTCNMSPFANSVYQFITFSANVYTFEPDCLHLLVGLGASSSQTTFDVFTSAGPVFATIMVQSKVIVEFYAKGYVKSDGSVLRSFPHDISGNSHVQKKDGDFIFTDEATNLVVTWDGAKSISVTAPESKRNQMKGLCGKFAGKKDEDYATPGGRVVDASAFAASWKAESGISPLHIVDESCDPATTTSTTTETTATATTATATTVTAATATSTTVTTTVTTVTAKPGETTSTSTRTTATTLTTTTSTVTTVTTVTATTITATVTTATATTVTATTVTATTVTATTVTTTVTTDTTTTTGTTVTATTVTAKEGETTSTSTVTTATKTTITTPTVTTITGTTSTATTTTITTTTIEASQVEKCAALTEPEIGAATEFCSQFSNKTGAFSKCIGVVDNAAYILACAQGYCLGGAEKACPNYGKYEKVCAAANATASETTVDTCDVCFGDDSTCPFTGDVKPCTVLGHTSVLTFDKATYSLVNAPSCEYTVASAPDDFETKYGVTAQTVGCGANASSLCVPYVKAFTVQVGADAATVFANGSYTEASDAFKVTKQFKTIIISALNAQLQVEYEFVKGETAGSIKVTIPESWAADKTEGLCGNANSDKDDDLDVAVGNSTVNDFKLFTKTHAIGACAATNFSEVFEKVCDRNNQKKCLSMMEIAAKPCYDAGSVDKQPYRDACQTALCNCGANVATCGDDSVALYVDACKDTKIVKNMTDDFDEEAPTCSAFGKYVLTGADDELIDVSNNCLGTTMLGDCSTGDFQVQVFQESKLPVVSMKELDGPTFVLSKDGVSMDNAIVSSFPTILLGGTKIDSDGDDFIVILGHTGIQGRWIGSANTFQLAMGDNDKYAEVACGACSSSIGTELSMVAGQEVFVDAVALTEHWKLDSDDLLITNSECGKDGEGEDTDDEKNDEKEGCDSLAEQKAAENFCSSLKTAAKCLSQKARDQLYDACVESACADAASAGETDADGKTTTGACDVIKLAEASCTKEEGVSSVVDKCGICFGDSSTCEVVDDEEEEDDEVDPDDEVVITNDSKFSGCSCTRVAGVYTTFDGLVTVQSCDVEVVNTTQIENVEIPFSVGTRGESVVVLIPGRDLLEFGTNGPDMTDSRFFKRDASKFKYYQTGWGNDVLAQTGNGFDLTLYDGDVVIKWSKGAAGKPNTFEILVSKEYRTGEFVGVCGNFDEKREINRFDTNLVGRSACPASVTPEKCAGKDAAADKLCEVISSGGEGVGGSTSQKPGTLGMNRLSACFAVIDPEDFTKVCFAAPCNDKENADATGGGSGGARNTTASRCDVLKAYEAACLKAGVIGLGEVVDKCGVCLGDGSTCADTEDDPVTDDETAGSTCIVQGGALVFPGYPEGTVGGDDYGVSQTCPLMVAEGRTWMVVSRGPVPALTYYVQTPGGNTLVLVKGEVPLLDDIRLTVLPRILVDGTVLRQVDGSLSISMEGGSATVSWDGQGEIKVTGYPNAGLCSTSRMRPLQTDKAVLAACIPSQTEFGLEVPSACGGRVSSLVSS